MKPIHKWCLGCGLTLFLCCGGPPLSFFAPSTRFPVGANIKDLGLTQDRESPFIWASSSREPIKDFAKRRQVRLAHFTGSIELSRPTTRFDQTQLQFIDGIVTNKGKAFEDTTLAEDMAVLQSERLSTMIAKTKNDWRIRNYNDYFIEPEGPFTGTITKGIRGLFPVRLVANLEVKNDLIIESSRSVEDSWN